MPDQTNVPVKSPELTVQEETLITQLLEYTDEKHNPWRANYQEVIRECYNFKELRQWEQQDVNALLELDVPAIPADRIGRNLDIIRGIRQNTKNRPKVVARNTGSKNVAELLDKCCDWADKQANAGLTHDDAFDGMIDIGCGIAKVGFDPAGNNGQGEFWSDTVNVESCGWSFTRKKDLSNIRWFWERMVMPWEDAIKLNPEKAGELNGLKTSLGQPWDAIKSGVSTPVGDDYGLGAPATGDPRFVYPDQVAVYEIWVKRIDVYRKVLTPVMVEAQDEMGQTMRFQAQQPLMDDSGMAIMMNGQPVMMPKTQITLRGLNDPIAEGEQDLGAVLQEKWIQHLIATASTEEGRGKGGVLLTPVEGNEASQNPYVTGVVEFKKDGQPRGFIEIAIPHQKRINVALVQKIAYNNKTLKSPIVIRSASGEVDIENLTQQSKIGAVLILKTGDEIVSLNTQLPTNMQAIEEGAVARQDMDFAASASEPVMRGVSAPGDSGIKLAQMQDAAITPLNKFTDAEKRYLQLFRKKMLRMVIEYLPPERMMMIVGMKEFQRLASDEMNADGSVKNPGIKFPIEISVEDYDVEVSDTGTTDLKKQQAYNAAMWMREAQIPLTDEVIIRNAPVQNVEEFLEAHREARQDIIMGMQAQIMQLQNELKVALSLIPRELKLTSVAQIPEKGEGEGSSPQRSNAVKGKGASQAGKRSMMGGQKGMPS